MPRRRLVRRLLNLPPAGVALLVAPAGYGASTLLRQVSAESSATTVWLKCPPTMSQGQDFWVETARILGEVGVVLPPVPDRLSDEDVWTFVGDLRDALSAGPPLLLILDDLGPQTPTEGSVQILLGALPDTVRLMIRTRRTPHLDVSRVLAGGRLVLLDRWDLSLEPEEADAYLHACLPDLPAGRRAALVDAAQGWVGALQAAVSGAGGAAKPDPLDWLVGPGLNLLFGPWFDAMEPSDGELLMVASLMDVITPAACDWSLGRSDSAERLARMAEDLVLTPPSDATGTEYRCHGLLRTYLIRRLRERGPEEVSKARTMVGRWLANQGDIGGAISQLLDVGAVDEARGLLDSHVGMLLDSGHSQQVQQWYRQIPARPDEDRSFLLLGAAWSELLSGDTVTAEGHLIELDDAVSSGAFLPAEEQPPAAMLEWLRNEIDYLRASWLMWQGSTDRALELVHQVRATYGEEWGQTAPQSAAMSEVRLNLWHRQDEAARSQLSSLVARPGTNEYYRKATLPSLRAALAASDGRAHRARFLAEEALAAMEALGTLGVMDRGDAVLARARAMTDLSEPGAAAEEATRLRSLAASVGHVVYETLAELQLALAHACAWNSEAAQDALEEARRIQRERGAGASLRRTVEAAGIETAVLAGDWATARRSLKQLRDGPLHDRLAVRVATMRGGLTHMEATQLVRSVRPTVPRDIVEARMLMASVAAESHVSAAEEHLNAAAETAHEFGMHRALAGRCEAIVALAERMAERGSSPAVSALLAAESRPFPLFTDPDLPPLSRGEYELLDRLAEVGSHKQLAHDMGISVNTVKTRLRRLYAKLGVHDRVSALRRVSGS